MADSDSRPRRVDEFFNAVSDPTRRRILLLLQERDCCVSELVEQFAVSQPTISRHLSVLKNAGLVEDRRVGQHIYYRLNCDCMTSCCSDYFGRFPCCRLEPGGGVPSAEEEVHAARRRALRRGL